MTIPMRRWRVLAAPLLVQGAVQFFVPAVVARLGVAMTGLALLFAVRSLTGSLALAGAATGVFALAEAAASPQWARLIDRVGQTVVVPCLVAVHVAAVAAAVLAAAAHSPALAVLVAAAVAGAAVPSPGAYSAARWTYLIQYRAQLRTAFALEAAVNDVTFLCGPLIVTGAVVSVAPWAGSVLAMTCLMVGCLVLVAQRGSAPPLSSKFSSRAGASVSAGLLSRAFLSTVGVNFGLGCFFGTVPVLVTSLALGYGVAPLSGLLLAIPSAASLAAGLAYGTMRRHASPHLVQVAAAALLVTACVITAAAPNPLLLCVTLLLGGMAIAPLTASSSQLVELLVPRDQLTQGFAWINTASAVGIAASSSLVAVLLERNGPQAGAITGTALVAIALFAALLNPRRGDRTSYSEST